MDPISMEALEYAGLKGLVATALRSPLGRAALDALAPSTDPAEVSRNRLRSVEALAYLREFHPPAPAGVEDPGEILLEIEPEGAIPEAPRVARILTVIRAGLSWREEIAAVRSRYPRLWEVAGRIPSLRTLLNDLAGRITPEGRLEDRASARLAEIRGSIAAIEGRLQRQLSRFMEKEGVRDVIQDAFVTVRNSRFVIPVKVESRRSVPGIIHGASSTGATVFVEPLEIVETNNELVTLRDEEEAEVRAILLQIGARLRANLPDLRALCQVMGEGDLLGAFALFSEKNACVPVVDADEISLERARHPVLEAALKARGESVVPLDLVMPESARVLVLSGPNTGGKTVSMKTLGLLALMNQSGMLVPAASAALPVFRQILADVGDRQSITENLSTFSARMLRVAGMSERLESPALVLLDEVGGGTDPEEEGALAVAIVEHFHGSGAWVLATTHHGSLKAWAEVTRGASNASMEFDESALAPTHRLLPGIAGRSGGLEMAERFGLPGSIIESARSRLGESHRMVDAYLTRLQAITREKESEIGAASAERERAAIDRREAAKRARDAEAEMRERYERAISEAVERIGAGAEELEKRLKDRTAALQLRSETRREVRLAREEAAASLVPPEPFTFAAPLRSSRTEEDAGGAIMAGARVRVGSLGAEGVVQSVNLKRRKVDLIIRGKKMTVALSDCEPVEGGGAPRPRTPVELPAGVTLEGGGKESVPSEINLIGRSIEEGLGALEKFLDDVILAGHREVRIVHGHGTGRLRKAVAGFLDGHPLVSGHHPADARSGGSGATVAVLKD
jgi:DNA mismatch repair protein MutS2